MDQPKRRLSAVWFADIVGYTPLSARDEPLALRLIGELQSIARTVVEQEFEGRIAKFIGDAVLAEFSSTESAVRAAVTLQERYAARAAALGFPSQLRTGVHLGEVVATSDGDLYGDGINTAARLQGQAAPGQVVVSEDVWRQLRQRPEFRFESLGGLELKGITTRVEVYNVLFGARAALAPPAAAGQAAPVVPSTTAERRGSMLKAAVAVTAVIALAALAIWMTWSPQSEGSRASIESAPPETTAQNAVPATSPPPAPQPAPPPAPAPATAVATPPVTTPPATAPAPQPKPAAEPAPIAPKDEPPSGDEPAAVRALLEEFTTALAADDGLPAIRRMYPSIRPVQVRALVTMRQQMGRNVAMQLGPVENRGREGNGVNIRFVVLASNGPRQMPLTFDATIVRLPGGWRFQRLLRVSPPQS
jgi:class 3 adenylate cyclase